MFNDDEYTSEDRAAGAWGAIILIALLGSCANKSYHKEQPKPEKPAAPKIEHIQPVVSTNQIPKNIFFYKTQFGRKQP